MSARVPGVRLTQGPEFLNGRGTPSGSYRKDFLLEVGLECMSRTNNPVMYLTIFSRSFEKFASGSLMLGLSLHGGAAALRGSEPHDAMPLRNLRASCRSAYI